jgi:hypothetical protein
MPLFVNDLVQPVILTNTSSKSSSSWSRAEELLWPWATGVATPERLCLSVAPVCREVSFISEQENATKILCNLDPSHLSLVCVVRQARIKRAD